MLIIPINRTSNIPLFKQIYLHMRKNILNGKLEAGDRLPSTRKLAADLNVSRNVILEAYDQLLAEGFLVSRSGSGTFIAEGTYLEKPQTPTHTHFLDDVNKPELESSVISFRSGVPDLESFPSKTWKKLTSTVWSALPSSILGYDSPQGRLELRRILAKYLFKTRGVDCHPDQIIITSGATQAMTLVSKLFLTAGDTVIMEDPITSDIHEIFTTDGAFLHPIPVDASGLQTSLLPTEKNPKFVFLTPSHQFPLGSTLPIQRRIELIHYAKRKKCYLIEDDYDSEFRYEGTPVSSLQGLAPELVLYIGSFSKILAPSLRMGYLILPQELVQKGRKLKWFTDLHTPSVDQLILAQFIEEGFLDRHILKMKKLYKRKRQTLIKCLQETFANKIEISGDSTGMHLIIKFKAVQLKANFFERTKIAGIEIYSPEDHAISKGHHFDKLIIGYGHLKMEEIEIGVSRLYKAIYQI